MAAATGVGGDKVGGDKVGGDKVGGDKVGGDKVGVDATKGLVVPERLVGGLTRVFDGVTSPDS
jgi:hypothetical protein